jgi:diguanylate cyclase (GGDEF)-like protein
MRAIAGGWLAAALLSIVSGVVSVRLGWNGVELRTLGLAFDVTIYPAFVVSALLSIWIGPTWGAVPIYLANLASALTSGLPLASSALFALAGPIETLMLWGTLVALRVDPDLRRARDLGWFLGGGLVAAVTGALAAILWNSGHGLDPMAGQRIFRGWVLGDFLQLVAIVIPTLRLLGPRARRWIDRQFDPPARHEFTYTRGVALVVAAFSALGVVVFLGVRQTVMALRVGFPELAAGGPVLGRLREIIVAEGLLAVALILATAMFSTALARMGERQRREARRDTLTGCYNRRAFGELFAREAERSRRLGLGVGLLMIDGDRFKEINDRYGHENGDLVLERLAARLAVNLRETDILFRWGGEEFVVVLPHTSPAEVEAIAERLRAAVAGAELAHMPRLGDARLTVSVGVAVAEAPPFDATALLRAADQACYEAKRQGRDRVVVTRS